MSVSPTIARNCATHNAYRFRCHCVIARAPPRHRTRPAARGVAPVAREVLLLKRENLRRGHDDTFRGGLHAQPAPS